VQGKVSYTKGPNQLELFAKQIGFSLSDYRMGVGHLEAWMHQAWVGWSNQNMKRLIAAMTPYLSGFSIQSYPRALRDGPRAGDVTDAPSTLVGLGKKPLPWNKSPEVKLFSVSSNVHESDFAISPCCSGSAYVQTFWLECQVILLVVTSRY
jgi:hypothetical protein